MKCNLKAIVELSNNVETEFQIIVEYKEHKEWDDYRTWTEIEIINTEIEYLYPEDAKEILENKIEDMFIEDFLGNESTVDNIFGSMKEFLETIQEIAES